MEFRRQRLSHLQSLFSQSRQRSNCAAKLQNEHTWPGFREALAVAVHGVQPPANFHAKSCWQSVLHERATRNWRGAVLLGQFGQGPAKGSQISFKKVESPPHLENETGIVRILAGCAPVNEPTCLTLV